MLHIGIDARPATTESRGLRTYSRNLLRELAATDRGLQLTLYTHSPELLELITPAPHCRIKVIPYWTSLNTHLLLPLVARRDQLHAMAFLANSAWLLPACPTVITIHDLTAELFPEIFYPTRVSRALRYLRRRLFRLTTLVITDSEASRKQILEHFAVNPAQVRVVPLAVNGSFDGTQPLPTAHLRPVQHRPYLLYVGALDFRKNLSALLKAFSWLKTHTALPHRLVLVGHFDPSRPALYPDLRSLARSLGVENQVDFLGQVPDPELPAWYRNADLFVFPSLYEGFGLPPLEAMASGVPVVCSDAASLPEVVGDAAVLVDARDAQTLAGAIQQVLENPALAQDLRRRGLERAKQFSWERTADQWAACIRFLVAPSA